LKNEKIFPNKKLEFRAEMLFFKLVYDAWSQVLFLGNLLVFFFLVFIHNSP